MTGNGGRRVPALKFKQWLEDWNSYDFSEAAHRRRPPEHLFMFSMAAAELRKLCDVYRRKRDGADAEGIQRVRDVTRTGRIQRYVRYGYPYGDLKPPQQTSETLPLRKPGWLPTAIVVNILTETDQRRGNKVRPEHLVRVESAVEGRCELCLPDPRELDNASLAPFEVIDGQHRLWAFDPLEAEEPVPDDFELPVVAFHGLDVAWQAYLFWSINVSPKRINPSHAFDLYPLLRTQDWLERVGELTVYREARAQEITELIFSHPRSPWRGRIKMLGERGTGVSQAGWVRALLTTFLSTGRGQGRPGLFQANLSPDGDPLEWSRAQQAAFLIQMWVDLGAAIEAAAKTQWWIRKYDSNAMRAFSDRTSMLNQDQGVRAVLNVVNDIFFNNADHWQLSSWRLPSAEGATSPSEVDEALNSLETVRFRDRMRELAHALVGFDWRSLDGPGVKGDEGQEVQKRSYRGSGGYAALRADVLRAVGDDDTEIGRSARELLREPMS